MTPPRVRRAVASLAIVLALASPVTSAGQQPAAAESVVVAVHDGDTVSVRSGGRTTRVRLVGIDCPEVRQPFSARARRFTSDLLFGRTVRVEAHGVDRYGRVLARILVDGADANEALVRAGLAWHYAIGDPNPVLEAAERAARASRVGLWSDPSPIPPWRWRREHARRP